MSNHKAETFIIMKFSELKDKVCICGHRYEDHVYEPAGTFPPRMGGGICTVDQCDCMEFEEKNA